MFYANVFVFIVFLVADINFYVSFLIVFKFAKKTYFFVELVYS